MSFGFAFRKDGLKSTREVFDKLTAAGEETRPLTEAIGQTITESAVHRLSVSNETPDGTPWPTSARARATGGKTQFKSGKAGLAGSLTYKASDDKVVSGSPLIYAAQRQFGGTIKPRNGEFLYFKVIDEKTGKEISVAAREVTQPAREYLGISDDDAAEITSLAHEHFANAMGIEL